MERKARTILLNHVGWKARKHPAKGGVFFLTFPFIELPGSRRYVPNWPGVNGTCTGRVFTASETNISDGSHCGLRGLIPIRRDMCSLFYWVRAITSV